MIKPITPKEAQKSLTTNIPDYVIAGFNTMIASRLEGKTARFTLKEVVALIVKTSGVTEAELYAKKHLNVESLYRKAGWSAVYDQPAYNESYDAFFVFSIK